MLFAGDQDFICNYMGIESMIQSMTWNGDTGLGVSFSSISHCPPPFGATKDAIHANLPLL